MSLFKKRLTFEFRLYIQIIGITFGKSNNLILNLLKFFLIEYRTLNEDFLEIVFINTKIILN